MGSFIIVHYCSTRKSIVPFHALRKPLLRDTISLGRKAGSRFPKKGSILAKEAKKRSIFIEKKGLYEKERKYTHVVPAMHALSWIGMGGLKDLCMLNAFGISKKKIIAKKILALPSVAWFQQRFFFPYFFLSLFFENLWQECAQSGTLYLPQFLLLIR